MKAYDRLLLAFSIAFAVFFITPAFLNQPFQPFPLMGAGDILDLLTPLVLIPLYGLLLWRADDAAPSGAQAIAFLALVGLWVEGQAMHLTGNSIGHLVKASTAADIARLVHFYDEQLGHYLWHLGVIGLSALLILRSGRATQMAPARPPGGVLAGAVIYGLTYAIIILEGATVPLGLPAAALLGGSALVGARQGRGQQSLLTFLAVAYFLALALFAAWGIYWKGFPEPLTVLPF